MVNTVTIEMIKTKVLNFKSSVPIVQCQNVCIPHLSKYTKIQMDLHGAEQIKYTNDYIINILYCTFISGCQSISSYLKIQVFWNQSFGK